MADAVVPAWTSRHAGSAAPADHYLLDLFWMPVVEPYAISEPFSTAGKVNLNYQIQPFTYITRSTAVRAVLTGEAVAQAGSKTATYQRKTAGTANLRMGLNLDDTTGTLRQFREKFNNGDIFKSPTELCDNYLVPTGQSWTSTNAAQTAWYGDNYLYVGDNVRERPYADIYPRVTTKSNVFRVYCTSQVLSNHSADPAVWSEQSGTVLGEYRGSTTIERYIDAGNTSLPDCATSTTAGSLDRFYRWRIVENTQFAP